jgi:hypothetical protein
MQSVNLNNLKLNPMDKKLKSVYYTNILALTLMITLNALANLLPINETTTDELANNYETMFTPAGYTSYIWSAIYAGLILFLIYVGRKLKSETKFAISIISNTGIVFLVSCMANVVWIIAWHYQQFMLTTIFIIVLLLSLIDLNARLNKISRNTKTGSNFLWMSKVPFGLYLGWMVIAVVANVSIHLKQYGFETTLAGSAWTSLMIIMVGMIALWLLARTDSISAAIAIIWGIVGIYVKQIPSGTTLLFQVSVILTIILVAIGIARIYRKRKIIKSA